jgi:hypothetical protein
MRIVWLSQTQSNRFDPGLTTNLIKMIEMLMLSSIMFQRPRCYPWHANEKGKNWRCAIRAGLPCRTGRLPLH